MARGTGNCTDSHAQPRSGDITTLIVAEPSREQALAAAADDGYELFGDERLVLRFGVQLAAPGVSEYQLARMLRYATRYHEFLREARRSAPTPGSCGIARADAMPLCQLVERFRAQARS
jgi:hypothetical protein